MEDGDLFVELEELRLRGETWLACRSGETGSASRAGRGTGTQREAGTVLKAPKDRSYPKDRGCV